MPTIRRSISITAPVDKVFDYVADPQHLPDVWPSMLAVENVARRPDGSAGFDWVYKMAGLKFRGHSEPVEFERNRRNVSRSERGIPNTFRWLYEGHDGTTELTLEVDYEVPILGRLLDGFVGRRNEREAEAILLNLKRKIETAW
jgi:uncharacterized protein YndB with AHSA1/START domain